MNDRREGILRNAVERGKYAPLYRHLNSLSENEWPVTFEELEKVLGFSLPDSAFIHRPWWANQGKKGGHSHALAWEVAGWKTANVDMEGCKLVFVRETQPNTL